MVSAGERTRNRRAFAHALAQQALEGLRVPASVRNDMQRAARGEILPAEGIQNMDRQFPHVQIFQP